jgi:hypothetical protein
MKVSSFKIEVLSENAGRTVAEMAAVIDAPLPPSLHYGATRQCKRAGFIGIRRKHLILTILDGLFDDKKKDVMCQTNNKTPGWGTRPTPSFAKAMEGRPGSVALPSSPRFRLHCIAARQDDATRPARQGGRKIHGQSSLWCFRRKPLILPVLASLCRFLPVFANKKKILWPNVGLARTNPRESNLIGVANAKVKMTTNGTDRKNGTKAGTVPGAPGVWRGRTLASRHGLARANPGI